MDIRWFFDGKTFFEFLNISRDATNKEIDLAFDRITREKYANIFTEDNKSKLKDYIDLMYMRDMMKNMLLRENYLTGVDKMRKIADSYNGSTTANLFGETMRINDDGSPVMKKNK